MNNSHKFTVTMAQRKFTSKFKLGHFARLDLSAKYNFTLSKKTKGLVGLSVWNVLKKKNIVNVYYQINDAEEIIRIDQEALGIVPNINFRIFFGSVN